MNTKQIDAIDQKLKSVISNRINNDKEKIAQFIQKKIQTKLDRREKLVKELRQIEKEVNTFLEDTEGTIYFSQGTPKVEVNVNYKYTHPKAKELDKERQNFIFELTIDSTDALKKIEDFIQKLNKI